jgi:catechol 2,3-dioxygenase-like lactoylglutathione lyase family enzyme
MAGMIIGIHHAQVCFPTDGIETARKFYCGLLGLPEIHRPFGPRGFWVRVGDRNMHFGIDADSDRAASKFHVAYQVSDLLEMRRRLTAAGLAIEDPEKMPGHERFQVRDPFGNLVEFIEPETGKEE